MLFFGFFARGGSTKRVLAQLTLFQRRLCCQVAGPDVAPPSVFYGHHYIEVRCVGSGMASSESRYYRKGDFCDQFSSVMNQI